MDPINLGKGFLAACAAALWLTLIATAAPAGAAVATVARGPGSVAPELGASPLAPDLAPPDSPFGLAPPRAQPGLHPGGSLPRSAPAAPQPALREDSQTEAVDLLDGANVRIDGATDDDNAGWSVSAAGDVNGDGLDDVVVGAPRYFDFLNYGYSAKPSAAYVLFGQLFPTSVDLAALGGAGFRIEGKAVSLPPPKKWIEMAAVSVSAAGDVNGDGLDDVVVGAPPADYYYGPGSAYVVFGKASTDTVDLTSLGSQGFRIDGAAANDHAGWSVADAGDMNGDGRDDVIVGALYADNNGRTDSGSAYLVFGKSSTQTVDLASPGSQGFRIDGAAASDLAGISVAGAGDQDGDGRDDVIVGAPYADNNGRTDSGSAYVVFGKSSTQTVDLASLGSQGFRIAGQAASDYAGYSVADAGDMNGDGRDDVIVGAPYADNNGRADSGSAYVIFGQPSLTRVDLAELGSQGFRVDGQAAYDYAGFSVAGAGDVIGNDHDDVIVGAFFASNNDRWRSGSAYIYDPVAPQVQYRPGSYLRFTSEPSEPIEPTLKRTVAPSFAVDPALPQGLTIDPRSGVISGTPGAPQPPTSYTVTLADSPGPAGTRLTLKVKPRGDPFDLFGEANIRIDGQAAYDYAGYSVAGAGDVNGDGREDAIVGALYASNNGLAYSGSAYVVFGKSSTETVDLASLGSQGFRIDGQAAGDEAGSSVAGAGDINGDGRDDVIVGAPYADNNGRSASGSAYVVFGKSSTQTVDLASLGSQGFRIDGQASGDHAGDSVSGASDVNGDGRDDLVVGAYYATSVYAVFGKSSTQTVDLASLGSQGFRIAGAGSSVSGAGDVNGDGRADVIVGASWADNNGRTDSGSAYVVFGKASTSAVDLASLGSQGFRIDGAAANDYAGRSVAGAGDMNGDGRADVIVGAYGADNNGRAWSGSAYVVFGKSATQTVDLASLGSQGFRIDGAAAGDQVGSSIAVASDVNGDGRDDLVVGVPYADNNGRAWSGSAYVVFGKSSTQTVDLASLGSQGYRVDGAAQYDQSGWSVASAGDINGNGRDDVIVGAPRADNDRTDSGSAYILYGCPKLTVSYDRDALVATSGRALDPLQPQVTGAATGERAFTASPSLPDGLHLDPRTGRISGTPTTPQSAATYTIAATDTRKCVGTTKLEIRVKSPGEPTDLLGEANIRIDGAAASDGAGFSVAGAGDVNADGRRDVVVGALYASPQGRAYAGAAYVVFGQPSPTHVDLAELGEQGFRIEGAAESDDAGFAISGAGDVNGDGRDDVIVGALYASNNGRAYSGSAYVVFGKSSTDTVDLASLASQGFRIDGQAADDNAGYSVAGAGDLNGDGRDDVTVGAPYADNRGREDSGSAYIVYGKSSSATVDLAGLGLGGLRIDGAAEGEVAGYSVAETGDVTGDGIPEVALGAPGASPGERWGAGSAYLAFGVSWPGAVDLAQLGGQGYRVDGEAEYDALGMSVADAGDENTDGRRDVVVGAPYASPQGRTYAGAAYLVYGKPSAAAVDLASASPDFVRMQGAFAGDYLGESVAGAGDVTGDGRPDLVLGAPLATRNGRSASGAAYLAAGCGRATVAYPQTSLTARVGEQVEPFRPELTGIRSGEATFSVAPELPPGLDLDRKTGTISGQPTEAREPATHTVTAAYANGACKAEASITVRVKGPYEPRDLGKDADTVLDGPADRAYAGYAADNAGDVNGDGIDDLIVGAPNYLAAGDYLGSAYVVFGQPGGQRVDLADPQLKGFRILSPAGLMGSAVAGAGDVNGDGLDDVAVAAYGSGTAYVVFGKESPQPEDVTALGSGGFAVRATDAVESVSEAGDVNGDGRGDLVAGVPGADPNGRQDAGAAYLVFGSAATDPVDLGSLGGRGFAIAGAAANDETGWSVSGAGDVNKDGTADLIVGAHKADPQSRQDAGSAYVVFGGSATDPVDLAALGGRGFRIDGAAQSDYTGRSVSGAGDINGDGRPDVVVGAYGADPKGRQDAGAAYVVFGSSSGASVDLASLGQRGFRIEGAAASDYTGASVARASDPNADGRDDVIVGAPFASPEGRTNAGAAYLALGSSSSDPVDLSDLGERGFGMEGAQAHDFAGYSVAGAGDQDGGGRADAIVGAPYADAAGRQDSGAAYVLYGEDAFAGGTSASKALAAPGYRSLAKMASRARRIRVIVGLKAGFKPEEELGGRGAAADQRRRIADLQQNVIARLAGRSARVLHRYRYIPALAVEVNARALKLLASLKQVGHIGEDALEKPALAQSVPLIGGPATWQMGYSGKGQAVAVLDTGVDKVHPFLAGKVVSEACYSTTDHTGYPNDYTDSVCPSGAGAYPGAGVPCPFIQLGCDHGTHVAGIATGNGDQAGVGFSGVAKDAKLIPIQVFSHIYYYGYEYMGAWQSDQIAGLERVYALRDDYDIAAVNMSLGGSAYSSPCDACYPERKQAIDTLRAAGIATVIAAGNSYYYNRISAPACISSAVSVGSTYKTVDRISDFSNRAYFLSLLAPGGCGGWCATEENITSSVPGGGYAAKAGTSMATPHVAGAFAVMRSQSPGASVSDVLSRLSGTGVTIHDPPSGLDKPRIQIDRALAGQPGTVTRTVDLASQAALEIDGAREADYAGTSVAGIGDLTGDPVGEVLLGAPYADYHDRQDSGAGYVVFGNGTPSGCQKQKAQQGTAAATSAIFGVQKAPSLVVCPTALPPSWIK